MAVRGCLCVLVFVVVLAVVDGKKKLWVGGGSDWADVTSWTGSLGEVDLCV